MLSSYLRNGLLFVVALCLGSALLYPLFPGPEFMRSELDYFEQHKDEFDVVFIGSSVIRRGVIPRQFDERMGELGHELTSFNLGIPGMRAHEVNYFMDQVLALKPARLKWLVVELDRYNPVIHEENRMAPRMVFWHDLPQTLLALKSIQLEGGSILKQLERAKTHGVLLGAKASNIGQGPSLLKELRDNWVSLSEETLATHHGWVPHSAEEEAGLGESPSSVNRRLLLGDPEWYASEVQALIDSNRNASSHDEFNFEALDFRIQRAKAAGVGLLHIIPPQLDLLPELKHALGKGLIENVLDYHSPLKYPRLYAEDHRFDRNHLNTGAASIWTNMLAEDMAALIAGS